MSVKKVIQLRKVVFHFMTSMNNLKRRENGTNNGSRRKANYIKLYSINMPQVQLQVEE